MYRYGFYQKSWHLYQKKYYYNQKLNIITLKKILLQSKNILGQGKEGRKERRNEGNVFVQMYVMLQPAPTPQRSGLWSSIPPLGGGGVTRGISSA
jgi:hypothetical protein